MKKISVVIPTYNEEDNVTAMYNSIRDLFSDPLKNYQYELIFIDNDSHDKTREILTQLCSADPNVKAIFNAQNFGYLRSPYHGLTQTTGDCAILMACDFQDPPDLIPEFVHKWEEGNKIVCGIKTSSKENGLIYFLRGCYYKLISSMSTVEQIKQFTGFGLYDKSFIKVLADLHDPMPYMRGIVAELGFRRCEVPFSQPQRKAGKSSSRFIGLYDVAMLGFTTYTKGLLRIATFGGVFVSGISLLIGIIMVILKLVGVWANLGYAALMTALFFIGGVQLTFIGLLGEYVMATNTRVLNRPLVVEECRLNFETEVDEKAEKELTTV